jgi:uncharacterized Zn finger protein
MHVRISNKGWHLLNDRSLAAKVADAIMNGKEKLRQGQEISVDGNKVSVKLVTSIEEKDSDVNHAKK